MEPERWQRIEALLHRALDSAPAARAALLDRECRNDPALRTEVESLLAAAGETDLALAGVALRGGEAGEPPPVLEPGLRLGAWRIVALIGRGGMGEVYRAERADGAFHQQVAIKLLRREAGEHLARFHAERRILARLEHPGIARLIDSTVTDDGRPAMVMEYVDGVPLLDWCRQRRADLATRLGLFAQVCDAVGFAHANLVIHRDLKPGNILVGADGRVKLLDFGVAKLLDPGAWNEDSQTRTRLAPMTPAHAAPEQLRGETVTTATDVYALGIVLFELLAGRPPWQLRELPLSVALHKLLSEEAPPVSEVSATASEAPVSARMLRGDLDAITARALRKDPRERYPTVAALRADLDRHLAGEPVSAHRGGEWYRIGKLLRRNRLAVALTTFALLVGAGFVWRLVLERNRALAAETHAQQEAAAARQVSDYLVTLFEAAAPDKTGGKPIEPRRLIDEGRQQVDAQLKDQPLLHTRMLATLARLYSALSLSTDGVRTARDGLALYATLPAQDPLLEAELWSSLGDMQYIQNDSAAAHAAFTRALALLEGALPADDPRLLGALVNLGQTEAEYRDRRHGSALLERALAGFRKRGDTGGEATVLTYLQSHYRELGRLDAALAASDRAMTITTPAAGAEPDTDRLMVMAYRTGLLKATGRWDESERLCRELVAGYTRLMGPDADWTSNRRYWLGVLLNERGKAREAAQTLLDDVASARRAQRVGSDLGLTLLEAASALRAAGDLPRSLALHAEAQPYLEEAAKADPAYHRHLYGRYLRARALIAAGQLAPAEALLAVDLPARDDASGRNKRALRRIALAELALARRQPGIALAALDEAAALKPEPGELPPQLISLRLAARWQQGADDALRQSVQAQLAAWRDEYPDEAPWVRRLLALR